MKLVHRSHLSFAFQPLLQPVHLHVVGLIYQDCVSNEKSFFGAVATGDGITPAQLTNIEFVKVRHGNAFESLKKIKNSFQKQKCLSLFVMMIILMALGKRKGTIEV